MKALALVLTSSPCILLSVCFSHVFSLLQLQILSVQQLYRICTLYWDGNYNTRSVSPDVSLCLCCLRSHPKEHPWSGKCFWLTLKFFFRSFQAWGCLWPRTRIMLKMILSCWMTAPGESACIRNDFRWWFNNMHFELLNCIEGKIILEESWYIICVI